MVMDVLPVVTHNTSSNTDPEGFSRNKRPSRTEESSKVTGKKEASTLKMGIERTCLSGLPLCPSSPSCSSPLDLFSVELLSFVLAVID
ncbi:hypothetical protein E2C01_094875 [Portunus trituberculatus]|uniref:Uncharacterized protein n=1 Tax=Portunus trituberculatus TaxID=210409 RepID=A0A5B7JNC2_PORTR|nr:hypothetical protein [Portunus trituberculatus]